MNIKSISFFCCIINGMAGKKTAQELGKWGEIQAKSYLEERGYEVLSQNVYTEHGEIDLIAKREGQIHFVEVKTRSSTQFGHPEESITSDKLKHMVDSAEAFLQDHPEFEGGWQIDVIAIQVSHRGEHPEIRFFENAI